VQFDSIGRQLCLGADARSTLDGEKISGSLGPLVIFERGSISYHVMLLDLPPENDSVSDPNEVTLRYVGAVTPLASAQDGHKRIASMSAKDGGAPWTTCQERFDDIEVMSCRRRQSTVNDGRIVCEVMGYFFKPPLNGGPASAVLLQRKYFDGTPVGDLRDAQPGGRHVCE